MGCEQIPDQKGAAWQAASSAPDGVIVDTKIDDKDGVRNVQKLKRSGGLWFLPDGSMYVYYRPTHWRPSPLPFSGRGR